MPVTNTPLSGNNGTGNARADNAASNESPVRTDSPARINGSTRYRAAVICASDRCFQGLRKDASSSIIAEMLTGQGYVISATAVLPDELEALRAAMANIADEGMTDLIITTGGTGLAPRDVTPEATAAVIDRTIPGIPETMRAESMKITPHGMLSRGIAGIRKRTLIINLPGSPKAAKENLSCILPALAHALSVLTGGTQDCAASRSIEPMGLK